MVCLRETLFVGILISAAILLHQAGQSNGNIHRAVPGTVQGNVLRTPKVGKTGSIIIEEDEDDLSFIDKIYLKANSSWLWAICGAFIVGSTGILPLLIFRVEDGHSLKEAISPNHLKLLLSFAVGGLLGDVFLHLLPEAWMYNSSHDHVGGMKIGLWMIAGLLSFMIIEKIFMEEERCREIVESKKEKTEDKTTTNQSTDTDTKPHKNGTVIKNGGIAHSNGHVTNGDLKKRSKMVDQDEKASIEKHKEEEKEDESIYSEQEIKVIGYLNLIANCSDNFTHGLAVAGSFLVSVPVGVCTTFAILLHEIPHEIGDFAILLKAGFKRWEAAKGQMLTASGAIFGCLFGLIAESAGDASSWVLPYTSGGFLYISLVTLVPDLLKEEDWNESLKQIFFLLLGIACMGGVTLLHH
ncbi:zinc transporter ZIP13-like [Clytia hemisphaerica]|uniref:Zinc transporter ZIP13 n=1 Tax=Clytia hemisphaerica TaxID=252671 RepID=A0A7M6DM28_9CNID